MSLVSYNGANRFPQPCAVCGKRVPAGLGILGGRSPNYTVHCQPCYEEAKQKAPLRRTCAILSLLPDGRVTVSLDAKVPRDVFDRYLATTASTGFYFDKTLVAQVGEVAGVPGIIDAAHKAGFDVKVSDPSLTRKLQEKANEAKKDIEEAHDRADKIDELLARQNQKMHPFQRKSVSWLAPRMTGVLANDQGTGKTLCTLASLPEDTPILVISPAVAKGTWLRELFTWRPDLGTCEIKTRGGLDYLVPKEGITILEGRDSFVWPEKGKVVITNYDVLPVTPGEHDEAKQLLAEWEQRGQPEEFTWLPPGNDEEDEETVGEEEIADATRIAAMKPVTPPPDGVVLIADEAHVIRVRRKMSARARRFRAVAEYVRSRGGRTWLLTGTPLLNEPRELWSILTAAGCAQTTFGSRKRFDKLFTKNARGAWDPHPSVPGLLKRCMLRYRKSEVLTEIPPKTRVHVPVEIAPEDAATLDTLLDEIEAARGAKFEQLFEEEQEKYRKEHEKRQKAKEKAKSRKKKADSDDDETEDDDPTEIVDGDDESSAIRASQAAAMAARDFVPFEELSRARTILAKAKIPAAFRIVNEYVERGEPILVFADHLEPVEYLYEKFGREAGGWALITGATSAKKRSAIEETFQRGNLVGIAATIGAAGVSITLTRAATAIFIEENWTPALNIQAADRTHRIGQFKDVTIKVLVADHAIDEKIAIINRRKIETIEKTVDTAARTADEVVLTDADDYARAAELAAEAERTPCGTGTDPREPSARDPGQSEPLPLTDTQKRIAEGLLKIALGHVPTATKSVDFANSLEQQLRKNGRLSEKQWAAAERMVSEHLPAGFRIETMTGSPQQKLAPGRRVASGPTEEWAASALVSLSDMDEDRAKDRNAAGFSKYDGDFGHSLAKQIRTTGALSEKQWAAAIKLASRYRRQVGEPPKEIAKVVSNPAPMNMSMRSDDRWHVIISEEMPGKKTDTGVTSPADVRTIVYEEPDGTATVQRFEFEKRSYTPDEAAAWVKDHGFDWIRVEG